MSNKINAVNINFPDSISELLRETCTNKVEIEQFILIAVAEKLDYLEERAKRGNLNDFEKILSKIPKTEPEEIDKIR